MARFAGQFVGGGNVPEALACATDLHGWDAAASLFYLGEYVDDPVEIGLTMDQLQACLAGLGNAGLDVHVSVDPTQVGSMISWDVCRDNVIVLARHVAEQAGTGRNVLMIDMEDSSVTGQTLALYDHLREARLPVGITVQAYLHRTQNDLTGLVANGAMVRLVKGAFAERASVAVTGRVDRDTAYRKAMVTLFSPEALARGVYPVLGTHDHRMIDFASHLAQENGWSPDQWEVEMLLGVRPDFQRCLVEREISLRLYLPFGRDWFPYSIRRVGENPKNLAFVLRSMMGRG